MRFLIMFAAAVTSGTAGLAHAESSTITITARLESLPRSRFCGEQPQYVAVRYRVEQAPREPPAALAPGQHVLVVHACPGWKRGWSPIAAGSAPAMSPGDRHLLKLRTSARAARAELIDPFPAGPPRYEALVTDPAVQPPRVIVTVAGAGTNHRIHFDGRSISVGSSPAADVMLLEPQIKPIHLLLLARGDHIVLRPARGAAVALNGQRLNEQRAITYRDRIAIGTYELQAAMLSAEWMARNRPRH